MGSEPGAADADPGYDDLLPRSRVSLVADASTGGRG